MRIREVAWTAHNDLRLRFESDAVSVGIVGPQNQLRVWEAIARHFMETDGVVPDALLRAIAHREGTGT